MKKSVIKLLAVLGLLGLVAACGTSDNNLASAPLGFDCVGTGCTTGITGTGTTFTSGDTEVWTPVNTSILSEYLGYPVAQPVTNPVVNIALVPTAGSSPVNYSGSLTIQFLDGNGTTHNGVFVNGTGVESYEGYTQSVNGLVGTTYRIFFEDPLGSIILTMAPQTGTDTSPTATGMLYFRNFNTSTPPPPLLLNGIFCWMITEGPYDCQNWSLTPTTGAQPYVFLGTIPTVNEINALGI